MPVRIELFDSVRSEWRTFEADQEFKPRCGNALHQFYPEAPKCVCGKVIRTEEDGS